MTTTCEQHQAPATLVLTRHYLKHDYRLEEFKVSEPACLRCVERDAQTMAAHHPEAHEAMTITAMPTCQGCGADLITSVTWVHAGRPQVWCSEACRKQAWRKQNAADLDAEQLRAERDAEQHNRVQAGQAGQAGRLAGWQAGQAGQAEQAAQAAQAGITPDCTYDGVNDAACACGQTVHRNYSDGLWFHDDGNILCAALIQRG